MGVIIIIGPDIRRRFSRPITGKGARTPSWDSFRPVLDKGENLRPLPTTFCRTKHHPGNDRTGAVRGTRVEPTARSKSEFLDQLGVHQDVFPVLFSSRVQSPPSPPSHLRGSSRKTRRLLLVYYYHRSHLVTRHPPCRAPVALMDIGHGLCSRGSCSLITRPASGLLGWDQAHLGGN